MTIALFLLAAAGPCAVPTLCPTRKELIAAHMAHAEQTISKMDMPVSEDSLDYFVRIPSRILAVTDMVCGEALPDTRRSMDCKFTVRHAHDTCYEVATLAWRDGKWAIIDAHGVWRKR
jgi:hypothetical protein